LGSAAVILTVIPEMATRIATAIEQRLRLVLEAAEQALEAHSSRSTQRVF
jgi:3-oxoacyl-[acyl-carrier-protein] synthase III